MEQYTKPPLCVDLDGTLIRTNSLYEAVLAVLKQKPQLLLSLVRASRKGRAYVKQIIGEESEQYELHLPYNLPFLAWLKDQHKNGRVLILATASDMSIAKKVSEKLKIFQDVIANTTDQPINASTKYKILCAKFGKQKFSYAGNSRADLSVWQCAKSGIIVNAPSNVAKQARTILPIEIEFFDEKNPLVPTILKEIRIHQWVKNLLLFVPPIAAHVLGNTEILMHAIIAFFSFSFAASSVYIMNDLLDIASDRAHRTKRHRPIASGQISISRALVLGSVLLLGSIVLALAFLPILFFWILILYFCITTAYSLRAKKIPYLDIIILAGLYCLRIIAGSAATGVPTSAWLFMFALWFFLSLAAIKRVTELVYLEHAHTVAEGRGYSKRDKKLLTALGTTSALFACIVLLLYTQSATVSELYTHPTRLIIIIPLLGIWTIRMWYLSLSGKLPDDPVLFASKDAVSYAIIVLTALATIMAI